MPSDKIFHVNNPGPTGAISVEGNQTNNYYPPPEEPQKKNDKIIDRRIMIFLGLLAFFGGSWAVVPTLIERSDRATETQIARETFQAQTQVALVAVTTTPSATLTVSVETLTPTEKPLLSSTNHWVATPDLVGSAATQDAQATRDQARSHIETYEAMTQIYVTQTALALRWTPTLTQIYEPKYTAIFTPVEISTQTLFPDVTSTVVATQNYLCSGRIKYTGDTKATKLKIIYVSPNSRSAHDIVLPDQSVNVLEKQIVDGIYWYKIQYDNESGQHIGWVKLDSLQLLSQCPI